jgi:NAD(P)-dependent dehydrogenase (short-subunit alcohol dehydrogenase family)
MSTTTIITGTTHGIGLVTARELVRAGHTVVMLNRNSAIAQIVRDTMLQQSPNATVHSIQCDLASLASVRQAANQVREMAPRFDLLINNAGTVSMKHRMSIDGFELTFATNHLGPFLLTELLRPGINADGRIINVASCAHYPGTLDLGSVVNANARYVSVRAYRQSKLANVLHTFALARRLNNSGITVTCLHPGVIDSNLLPRWLRLIKPLVTKETFGIERGAQTTIKLALDSNIDHLHGKYVDEYQHIQPASALANDIALQEALWAASEQWTRAANSA